MKTDKTIKLKIEDFKKGAECTVGHHYGHTDTAQVYEIVDVDERSQFNSGIAVKVNGIDHYVDAGLIHLIKEYPAKYEIVHHPELKITKGRNYRVEDKNGNFLIDKEVGQAAFTLKQASRFLYRLALKQIMEEYISGKPLTGYSPNSLS